MKKIDIKEIVSLQQDKIRQNIGMPRDMSTNIGTPIAGFATVISGIRRCGKSTLMGQIISKTSEPCLYINFDTPRLNDFTSADFELIDQIAQESNSRYLFFDEIQLISGWESYVRSALDAGFRVIVTGSNATMLSQELGTRLTGRHITKELFPFSFDEYCRFRNALPNEDSLSAYLRNGGFPQYLKQQYEEVLTFLLDDILYRDIAVRHGIKDVRAVQSLMLYLITNVGNLISANKLTQIVHVKTAKTILEYFSYLTQTYIVEFVSRYAYSYKVQMISPKKVYCIDNGLHSAVTTSATTDEGRRLENMVYCELRRRHRQLFYYSEDGCECDFIICEKNVPRSAYQVCLELTRDNQDREIKGIVSAMRNLNIINGTILTLNQEDTLIHDKIKIAVTPVWRYFRNVC